MHNVSIDNQFKGLLKTEGINDLRGGTIISGELTY